MVPTFLPTWLKIVGGAVRLFLIAPAVLVMVLPNPVELPDPPAKAGIQRRLPGRLVATVAHVWLVNTDSAGKMLSASDVDHLAGVQADIHDIVQIPTTLLGPRDRLQIKRSTLPATLCGRGPPRGVGV